MGEGEAKTSIDCSDQCLPLTGFQIKIFNSNKAWNIVPKQFRKDSRHFIVDYELYISTGDLSLALGYFGRVTFTKYMSDK